MSVPETIPGIETKSTNRTQVTWTGAHSFEAGRPGGVTHRIDGNAEVGPGPVDAVLNALASCISIDVVDILAKRRTPLRSLTVDVQGARAAATPSRLIGIHLAFHLAGEGIELPHAERAIELSANKYCSVRDSLDLAIPIRWTIDITP